MSRRALPLTSLICAMVLAVACFRTSPQAAAGVGTLKNGMRLEGRMGKIAAIGESPDSVSASAVTKVVLFDDDLRRVFVSSNQILNIAESEPVGNERIRVRQRVATAGRRIGGVGPIVRITPFDEWGRRIFSMNSPKGVLHIVQGITEVTPTYCKVDGLQGKNSYVWSSRIRTSTIPRETLSKILMGQIDDKNPDDRLRIVRLYIQAERYRDAQLELAQLIKEFPELRELEKTVRELRQFHARRLIREIRLRRDAGQHALAVNMLSNFPVKGVADETLITVRGILGEYGKLQQQGKKSLELLTTYLEEIEDEALRGKLATICDEIKSELNLNTLNRMADFLRLAEGDKLSPQQKIALAISGWLRGSGEGVDNLAVVTDMVQVRNLIRKYLSSVRAHEREEILAELQTLEGSSPADVAKLLANMKPPIETQIPEDGTPGQFKLSVPGLPGKPDFVYHIQLPPEYDPYRRYPCIVTLNGAGTTPLQQLDWWAGAYNDKIKMRAGQASRRGYVVIAPEWTKERQGKYEYTAREHAAVLYTLRDACRRFSIDTDRVFLSGHSMGGDAAWDIGLAHPDLWAGVVPVVATAGKYVSRYFVNASNGLPMYFVGGQYDGSRMEKNKMDFNRYLQRVGYDTIVVEYIGRGHEHFHDEIQELFDWMELQEREFFPKEFECVSMRPWDNFYWWAELGDFPEATLVMPLEWPKRADEAETSSRILENNGVQLTTAARKATVWLSPEMVDFDERVRISGRGIRTQNVEVTPTVKVILEDVRTRGDRQHPFWAKVEAK